MEDLSTLSVEELHARIAALEADKATLSAKRQKAPGVTFKVSPKGAIAVYGLGRFPTVLYRSQMERLLEQKENIQKFITDNTAALKVKEAATKE